MSTPESAAANDPRLAELREEVSATDRLLVEAVNRRLDLVATIKRYKDSRGFSFVDPERERALLAELAAANPGPLSAEGLEELVAFVLDLSKREVARDS
jgi:chorismate mutase